MDAARHVEAGDRDPVETVHELRVAVRRVRAHLRIFATVFDPGWLDRTIDQLRDLGKVIGGARDLDVVFGRLEMLVPSLPESDQPAAATIMMTQLRLDRGAAFRETLDALRDPCRATAIEDLAVTTTCRPLGADADNVAIEDLVAATRRQWRRLRNSVHAARDAPNAENMHKVRVRANTLRYSLETLEPVLPRSAWRHAKALVALQDHLGQVQDAVVIEQSLRVARKAAPSEEFVVGELIGLERARFQLVRDTWQEGWQGADRKRLRRWTR